MAKETLADFLIKIGVDAGNSLKQIDKIEARLNRLPTIQSKVSQTTARATGTSTGSGSKKDQTQNYNSQMSSFLRVENMRKKAHRDSVSSTRQVIALEAQLQRQKATTINAELAGAKKRVKQERAVYAAQRAEARAKLAIERKIDSVYDEANEANQKLLSLYRQQLSAVKHKTAAFDALEHNVQSVISQQRRLNREFSLGTFTIQGMKDSMKNMARSYLSIFAAVQGGGAVFNTAKQFEGIQNGLIAVSGDAETAAANFDMIKKSALDLGIALKPAADGFVKLNIAGKEQFDESQIKNMWTAMNESATAYNMTADDTEGAFRAMAQMMAKGKVTAEEFRGQLAERMPVAFVAMQRALGVSNAEFAEMLDKGQIGLDVLPKFATELRNAVREGGLLEKQQNSISASYNRLIAAIQTQVVNFSESGFGAGIKVFLDEMAAGIRASEPLWIALGAIAEVTLNILGTMMRELFEILGVLGEGLLFVVNIFKNFGAWIAVTAAALIHKLFGKKIAKLFSKFLGNLGGIAPKSKIASKGLAILSTAFLKFFNPVRKYIAIGYLLIGVLDEIFNLFRSDEDKKIGFLSAPEGMLTGFEQVVLKLTGLFKGMWDSIFGDMVKSFYAHVREIPIIGKHLVGKEEGEQGSVGNFFSSAAGQFNAATGLDAWFPSLFPSHRTQGQSMGNQTISVQVNAQTNANPQEIAKAVKGELGKIGMSYGQSF